MIKSIPKNQICQSFNPLMIFPSRTENMKVDSSKNNTSCFAPAYVYIEGSRGKRFLCDYHYFFEKIITLQRTPELWLEIEKFIINNVEEVKNTFAKPDGKQLILDDTRCTCGAKAYVLLYYKEHPYFPDRRFGYSKGFLCNFHYRKMYYRYISHNLMLEDFAEIRDERHRMSISITQEAENLPED